jgi:hypothetical protein
MGQVALVWFNVSYDIKTSTSLRQQAREYSPMREHGVTAHQIQKSLRE